jgi:hypothetical protein
MVARLPVSGELVSTRWLGGRVDHMMWYLLLDEPVQLLGRLPVKRSGTADEHTDNIWKEGGSKHGET